MCPEEGSSVTPEILVGFWNLEAIFRESEKGEIYYPLGKDAVGKIHYSKEGYVYAYIMCANRKDTAMETLFESSLEDRAYAAGTFQSYFGRYGGFEKQGDVLKYHLDIEADLNPSRTGALLNRYLYYADDKIAKIKADAVSLKMPNFEGKKWNPHVFISRI